MIRIKLYNLDMKFQNFEISSSIFWLNDDAEVGDFHFLIHSVNRNLDPLFQ